MKERSIIFDADSIQAILDNRKTQIRRVIEPQPAESAPWPIHEKDASGKWFRPRSGPIYPLIECPFGPGNRFWVKEAWALPKKLDRRLPSRIPKRDRRREIVCYRASQDAGALTGRWRSSRSMPRWASRITLEVIESGYERLQDIAEWDALAEGIGYAYTRECKIPGFARHWDSLNARRGYPWESNPWVWAVKFRLIEV